MSRPALRGSFTGRVSDVNDDKPSPNLMNGKTNDDCKLHGENGGSPGALRLLMRQGNHENILDEPLLSSSKRHLRSNDNGSINNAKNTDFSMSPDSLPRKSTVQCLEISPLPIQASHPNSVLALSSGQSRVRRGYVIPLGTTMMLCFVSLFIWIGVLSSSGPAYSLRFVPTLAVHKSYRRLQQEVVLDPFKGGIFGQGTVRLKELGVCLGVAEDHVPCYDSSSSPGAGLTYREDNDRYCVRNGIRNPCLMKPPDDYKVPLRWPACRDGIWEGNVRLSSEPTFSPGFLAQRFTRGEDGMIVFSSQQYEADDGMENFSQHIANIVGIGTGSLSSQVRTVLDINCGLTQLGTHMFTKNIATLCLSPHEINGSQVQLALERGFPAMIGSLMTRQLPFSRFSFDLIHCFECGFDWTWKDGIFILELDRILKPGGYVVWTSTSVDSGEALPKDNNQDFRIKEDFASRICWSLLSRAERTFVWKKTTNHSCYLSRGLNAKPKVCNEVQESNSTWYPLLQSCLTGLTVEDKIPSLVVNKSLTGLVATSASNSINGFLIEELSEDSHVWSVLVKSYWSLLTPLLFSDHPKRPGEEDPLPPSNIVRNVMDMNAVDGNLNAALLEAGKSVWVMNVVPSSAPNTLSKIYSRGLVGVLHDWCEAFPTYPRTYDLLHAIGLLSQEVDRPNGCGLSNLFLEMDRILRPEGWVILRDKVELIEDARVAAGQMRWESRIVEVEGINDLQLLVCQKIFWKH